MMNEWIISSSILIAAVLLGRRLLRGKISLRLQYALWGIVLVRLLLPVQLFTSDFGAGSIAKDVDISAPVREVYISANEDRYERAYDEAYRWASSAYEFSGQPADPIVIEQTAQDMVQTTVALDLKGLLTQAWLAGMAVMTAVIAACNLHLSRQLRCRRWEYPAVDCLLRVYVTEVLPTPCIFGIFRPVIYLTPEAAKDERLRYHVLVHEQTHYRHFDHIWSVLRSVCLVLHWYNPLVWLAVKASKADAELACDEGVLARLGESQRADYGRTLIGLTCAAPMGDFLLTATTMTGSAGSIRQRIKLLMARPRNTLLTLSAVILIGTLVVGCAFAGAPETTPPATEPEETVDTQTDPSDPVENQPIAGDPEMIAFFDDLLNPFRSGTDWYARALTSYYDSPAGIDLYQLFYNGIPGTDNTPAAEELAFLDTQPGYHPDFDLFRIPGQEMDRVLNEYLGIGTAEALGLGLENFMYNPQTDCYYHSHTDTNLSFLTVTAAQELPGGNWLVLYTEGFLGGGEVVLRQQGGKWQIVSHLPIGTATASDFLSGGILVYPGTEWGMTVEEVQSALNITEYGILSGNYGFILFDQTFLGQNADIAFYFTRHTEADEWGLSSVRVSLEDEDVANAVWNQLHQELGKPDFWTSGVASGMWYSDLKLADLVSEEAYAQYQKTLDPDTLANASKELTEAASSILWLGDSPPNPSNQVWFSSDLATAMQIERSLGSGQAAEVAALFDEGGDPWYLAALNVQYQNWYYLDTLSFFTSGQTSVALTDAETALIVEHYGKDALNKSIFRMTSDRMNEIVSTYIGCDLWGLTRSGFLYCQETDAYLAVKAESTELRRPEILSCQVLADNEVLMLYCFPGEQQRYAATLFKQDTWQVIANQLLIQQPVDARVLTEDEIARVNEAYNSFTYDEELGRDRLSDVSGFFNCIFSDPTQINLEQLLRYYSSFGEADQREWDLLRKKYGEDLFFYEVADIQEMPIPVHRYEIEFIDQAFRRYTGISYGDLKQKDTLYHLDETQCYYNGTSDANPGRFVCQGGWIQEDGVVLYSRNAVLLLTGQDGKYYIQAHLPAVVVFPEQVAQSAPILADYASDRFSPYYTYLADESEYLTSIAFTPTQRLRNVEFGQLIATDANPNGIMEILYSMDELDPQHPFLARVVFWGDTTTYYISFTDENRNSRRFAVSISGENGNLVCTECPIDPNYPVEYLVSNPTDLPFAPSMDQAMAEYADRNPRKLNDKELQAFRSAFTAIREDGTGNPAACFLLPYYADISEMDGNEFLAYFPTVQEGTQEEFDLLKAKYPDFFEDWTWETMPIPIHRHSAKEIETVVSRYAGIHWQELDEGVHYLEETGCYYNYTSDFGLGGFHARNGFVYDGGAVVYSDISALFFTETLGNYTIQAHLPLLLLHSSNPMIPTGG